MPKLKVIEASGERWIDLGVRIVTIGRGDECTVPLATERASREHCSIEPVPGGYKIVDFGSTNGTRVNGVLIAQKKLERGDRIEIGSALIVFDAVHEPAVVPAPPRATPPPERIAKPLPHAAIAPAPKVEPARLRSAPRTTPVPVPPAGGVRNGIFLGAAAAIAAMLTIVVLLPKPSAAPASSPSEPVANAHAKPATPETSLPSPVANESTHEIVAVATNESAVPTATGTTSQPAPDSDVHDSAVAEKANTDSTVPPPDATKPTEAQGHLQNPTKEGYYLLVQEAGALARSQNWDEAIAKLSPALTSCPYPDVRDEMRDRVTDWRLCAGLLGTVVEQVTENSAAFSAEGIGLVRGADARGVVLASGAHVGWRDIKPRAFVDLARHAKLAAIDTLGLAAFCFENELEDEAHLTLERLAESQPSTKREIDLLLSRRLFLEVPEGGFVVFDHHFMPPSRRDQRVREAEMNALAQKLASTKGDERRQLVTKLRGYGEPGEARLEKALIDRKSELSAKIAEQALTKRIEAVEKEKEKLEKLRESALTLIFDEIKYPYPYKAPEAPPEVTRQFFETQKEVDKRVQAVRDAWKAGESHPVQLQPAWVALVADWREVSGLLQELRKDFDPPSVPRCIAFLDLTGKDVSVRTCFESAKEADDNALTAAILKWNGNVAARHDKEEVEQVRVTNDYRILMGRHAVAISDKLMASAHKHSAEMSRLGYFSHVSPTAGCETVDLRVRAEGYEGSDVSENIAEGGLSPESAHEAWLHSSGHHRNILREQWSEMGSGKSGRCWTQNFGFSAAFVKQLLGTH
ncbi:MAG: FHA domain-containing protein [Planctomycetes bacterium]|nr:FHA domain-containing protein [Planctomycetota bacterium]